MTPAALAFALVFLALVHRRGAAGQQLPHLRLPLLILLALVALWHPRSPVHPAPPATAPSPPPPDPRPAAPLPWHRQPIACTPDSGSPDAGPSTMLAADPPAYAGELQAADYEHARGFVVGASLR